MLRNTLLWASTNPFLAERLPRYGFVRRATRRFMPGETLEDALGEAERLEGDRDPPPRSRSWGRTSRRPAEADAVVDALPRGPGGREGRAGWTPRSR